MNDQSSVLKGIYTQDDSQNSQNDFQEINEPISPTYSEMKPPSQLMTIIISEPFEINKDLIRKDFLQEKYLRKRFRFFQKYSEDEQNNIRAAWYEYMIKIKAHIMFFDYLPIYKNQQENKKYFTGEKIQKIFMNQKTTTTWLTSDNKIIETIHPPSEKIQINVQNNQIQAAPFKLQNETSSNQTTQETNKIIEQNNYTNRHLQTLGVQLSRIENIIQDKIKHSREETKTQDQKIKPFPELDTPSLMTTTSTPRTSHKDKNKVINVIQEIETSSDDSIQEITKELSNTKINPLKIESLTSYYYRLTYPDLQIEERGKFTQASYQKKIDSLKNNIIKNLCSDIPDAFWHRKRHMVSLSYQKDFTEQNIPTKARPIQMNYELMEHCKKEIQELLNKRLIEPSKSLWSCTTFCIQKSIINYKTIKIRIYTSFRRYEWTIVLFSSQNASRKIQKIMNEFFKSFSSFPIEHTNNKSIVLTNKLVLPRTKLYLFILHNYYISIQRSALFFKKFPNVIVNKKQLPISYLVFSTIYDNLTFPNSIEIKNLTIWHLHNFCEKLHLFSNPLLYMLQTLQDYYQSLTKREKRILTSELLKGDESIDSHLQLLCRLKTSLTYENIKYYKQENIFQTNQISNNLPKPFHDYVNILSFILQQMEGLPFDDEDLYLIEMEEILSKEKFLSPKEVKQFREERFLSPKELKHLREDIPSPTEIEIKHSNKNLKKEILSPTEIEIRNSRAFFFPNSILRKLRDYNLHEIVEDIQNRRNQNLFKNFELIQNFLRGIASNPEFFHKISASHLSYYLPHDRYNECLQILDTCQNTPAIHYSCTCHLAYTIYTACWDLSGPHEYIFHNKSITPQFLMDHGMLQQVLFTDPSHFDLFGRKISLVGMNFMITGFPAVQMMIKSTPPKFIHHIEPAKHLIHIKGFKGPPHLIKSDLWDCPLPLEEQICHWRAKTVAANWDHFELPYHTKLVAEDQIQKIYPKQFYGDIRFNIQTNFLPLIKFYEDDLIQDGTLYKEYQNLWPHYYVKNKRMKKH
ncbi:hypothetical protein CFOL_v3_30971 [Cephalotus follicularis]|uniref:DUF7588 domain-containing protein n=1 Tax=Cephalotus follicularis TaxID=3775 RepID=A0A1Q3D506_CEPFO|nr:hypothetical protein CFOL_v3_30971 [Cephalotus follicularis]